MVVERVEKRLGVQNLYNPDQIELLHHVEQDMRNSAPELRAAFGPHREASDFWLWRAFVASVSLDEGFCVPSAEVNLDH